MNGSEWVVLVSFGSVLMIALAALWAMSRLSAQRADAKLLRLLSEAHEKLMAADWQSYNSMKAYREQAAFRPPPDERPVVVEPPPSLDDVPVALARFE